MKDVIFMNHCCHRSRRFDGLKTWLYEADIFELLASSEAVKFNKIEMELQNSLRDAMGKCHVHQMVFVAKTCFD